MWGKFGLGDVMIVLFHSHGQEDTLECRVDNSRCNLFDKSVKSVKMQYR